MTSPFPEFDDPAWSATFHSYDQYRDDIYYELRLAGECQSHVTQIDVAQVGEDATATELAGYLRDELARVASGLGSRPDPPSQASASTAARAERERVETTAVASPGASLTT